MFVALRRGMLRFLLVILLAAAASRVAAAAPRSITCGDPRKIGTPVKTLDTTLTGGHTNWSVVTSRRVCVIVAWTDAEIVASFDDGRTFAVLGIAAPGIRNQSAAIGDDGTIYVVRSDSTLTLMRPDGTTTVRTLAPSHWEPVLRVRGTWLWLYYNVVGNHGALSNDEGANWTALTWTEADLVDLVVLADGTLVGLADYRSAVCDHFGCGDGPLNSAFEARGPGGPWKPATKRHARKLTGDYGSHDRHGYMITRDLDSRFIARTVGREHRRLYVTRPTVP